MRAGRGGNIAVAAASALLAVCLAGGPLYVSSSASESVQVDLSRTCLADAGLDLTVLTDVDPSTGLPADSTRVLGRLDDLAAKIPNTQRPVATFVSRPQFFVPVGATDPARKRVIAVYRDDQFAHIETDLAAGNAIADDEAIVPAWDGDAFGVGASDRFEVTVDPPSVRSVDDNGNVVEQDVGPSTLTFAIPGTYQDIPTRPEPSYWCAQRKLFRLTGQGDRPTPVVFVTKAAIAALDPRTTWELRPKTSGLTRAEAKTLLVDLATLNDTYSREVGIEPESTGGFHIETVLDDLIRRADARSEVVSRTIAPIRLGGVAAALLLLVASGVMVARERRRDLRLRVLRGTNPFAIAVRVSASELVPVAIGTVLGTALAFLGVRALGPTPELEPGPVRVALITVVVGLVTATLAVGVVAAVATARSVDGKIRRRHVRLPWELAVVPLAIASYTRLDQIGGVRLVGAAPHGGDLLAQAFPILAIAAPLALVARPLVFVARRLRRIGRNLPTPALVGLRRISHEPAASVILCVAVALAVGSYVVSGSLTASAQQLLRDKTNTYLGGDMIVRTRNLDAVPAALAGIASPVGTSASKTGGRGVDLIGIDPNTFEDAVHWRADASDESLHELVQSIADDSGNTDGPLHAIVVGDLVDATVTAGDGDTLTIDTVASPRWFPGLHNGSTLVVVDLAALQAHDIAVGNSIWLRNPPADTEQILVDNGTDVLNIRESADVVEVTSFLTVRWSYAVLAAFGVLVGCIALFAQLLVLDARRQTRQATWTLTSRMGMSLRAEAMSMVVEMGLPLLVGSAFGLALGWGAVAIAVPRLDSLRQLQPPARLIIDLGGVVTSLVVGVVVLALLVVVGMISVVRTRPMEVMRGGN